MLSIYLINFNYLIFYYSSFLRILSIIVFTSYISCSQTHYQSVSRIVYPRPFLVMWRAFRIRWWFVGLIVSIIRYRIQYKTKMCIYVNRYCVGKYENKNDNHYHSKFTVSSVIFSRIIEMFISSRFFCLSFLDAWTGVIRSLTRYDDVALQI